MDTICALADLQSGSGPKRQVTNQRKVVGRKGTGYWDGESLKVEGGSWLALDKVLEDLPEKVILKLRTEE